MKSIQTRELKAVGTIVLKVDQSCPQFNEGFNTCQECILESFPDIFSGYKIINQDLTIIPENSCEEINSEKES